ncbi:hypothetical protein [Lacticaseibacillus daqingensis]|uniref:hypothetical protein n=1 Tax=Lacticaseibacillus daqingensis TaxID=2486014 RepID=UPI001CDC6BAD|nr:hypothetical protein [Lacticaseibacillus daqingensis]
MMTKIRNGLMRSTPYAKRGTRRLYAAFRLITLGMLLSQLYLQRWEGVGILLLTFALYALPWAIVRFLKIEIPNLFEGFIICFIFSAMNLGEMRNFYNTFPLWDTALHTLNGFLAAGVGLSLVELLNHNAKRVRLSPVFIAILTFSFSMTIGVLWEFGEYTADNVLGLDMQKDRIVHTINSVALSADDSRVQLPEIDRTVISYQARDGQTATKSINGYLDIGLHDTMKDLFVNLVGAVCFAVFAYFYELSNAERFQFIQHFVPKRK